MPNIFKKIPVLLFLCLLTWKINAQSPVSANQATQRIPPSQRTYSWYLAEVKKRSPFFNFTLNPVTQVDRNRLPVYRSYEGLRQHLIAKYPMLQTNSSIGSLAGAGLRIPPAQRTYAYYQQEAMKKIKEAQQGRPSFRDDNTVY